MSSLMLETVKNFKRYVNISQFSNKNCVYIGYIETINDLHHFKYGETSNIIERNKAHVKEFKNFGLVYVVECKVSKSIETQFKTHLVENKILTTFRSNTKVQTEIFYSKSNEELNDIINVLERLVKCESDLKNNKNLEHENEMLKKDNEVLQKEIKIREMELVIYKLENKNRCTIL